MTKEQLLRHLSTLDDLVTESAVYTTAALEKLPEPATLSVGHTLARAHLGDVSSNLEDAQNLLDHLQKEIKNG